MWFRSLLDSLKLPCARAVARQGPGQAARGRPATARPRLEPLEDRCLLSFVPTVDYPVGISGSADVVVADFNVDGILDQVAGDGCLLGNGDGTFRYAASPSGETVADFNLDGFPDVASSGGGVYLGHGDGTFEGLGLGTYGYSVAAGDINYDGKPDVVIGYSQGDSWSGAPAVLEIVYGNGDGTFGPPTPFYLYGFADYPGSLALADL